MMLTSPADSINLGDTAGCRRRQKLWNRPIYTAAHADSAANFIWYSHTSWFPHILEKEHFKKNSNEYFNASSSITIHVFYSILFILLFFFSFPLFMLFLHTYELRVSKFECLVRKYILYYSRFGEFSLCKTLKRNPKINLYYYVRR